MEKVTSAMHCFTRCFNLKPYKSRKMSSASADLSISNPKIITTTEASTKLSYRGFRGCHDFNIVHKSETPVGDWHNHQCLSSPVSSKALRQRLVKLVAS